MSPGATGFHPMRSRVRALEELRAVAASEPAGRRGSPLYVELPDR